MKNNFIKNYEPHPCEVCKMCSIYINSIYDSGEIYCEKYEKGKSHHEDKFYGVNKLNHKIFNKLYEKCDCNKNYPSRWKIFKFKLLKRRRQKEDIKYKRYEV